MEKITELTKVDGSVYMEIFHDPKNKLVMDVWKGTFGTQDNFRIGIIKVLSAIKAYHCKRWVADIREMIGSYDSSSVWMKEKAVPQAIDHGLRKAAVIWPQNVFSKLSTKDTLQKIDSLELRAFDNPEDTIEWMLDAEKETNS